MEERTTRILYGINEETAKYYHSILKGEQGEAGIACLKGLGLTEETIDRFRLGYTGKDPKGLVSHLKNLGYLDNQIIEAGLAEISEGDTVEDIFQNRVIIPIIDDEYRVIGFSGRAVNDDKPIYLNTCETPVFDKKESLFGLDHVKDSAAQYIILCEGYMDVMAMHQAGFDMAVASLGIGFTPEHAKRVKKYAHDVIICYDCDEAGRNAASNVSSILNEVGITVKQIDLSPHRDPSEFISKEGGTAFGELLRSVLE